MDLKPFHFCVKLSEKIPFENLVDLRVLVIDSYPNFRDGRKLLECKYLVQGPTEVKEKDRQKDVKT